MLRRSSIWLLPLLTLILILFAFCADQKQQNAALLSHRSLSAEELQADFELLISTLREKHPALYRVSTKTALEQRISSIRNNLRSNLGYLEFLKLLAPLFTDIGCIATQWSHPPEFLKFRNQNIARFPLGIKIENQQFYIKDRLSATYSITAGSRIVSIDGESPADYLDKNYKLLPRDGQVKTLQRRWLERYFAQHHANFWAQPQSFDLVLQSEEGTTYKRTVPAVKSEALPIKRSPSQQEPLTFMSNIALLDCRGTSATGWSDSFVDSCFRVISENNTKLLLLDLRGAGAQWPETARKLFDHLKSGTEAPASEVIATEAANGFLSNLSDYQQILTASTRPATYAYTGRLYVLINGWTIGYNGLLCSRLSKRPSTFFAGEESGAGRSGMQDLPFVLTLPNSGLKVSIPTFRVVADKQNPGSLRGVMPQISLPDSDDLPAVVVAGILQHKW